MCRNIRPLFNYSPSVTKKEIDDAALQFIKKVSGFQKPSHINEKAFNQAVNDTSSVLKKLLDSLITDAPKRNRKNEIERARKKAAQRFGL